MSNVRLAESVFPTPHVERAAVRRMVTAPLLPRQRGAGDRTSHIVAAMRAASTSAGGELEIGTAPDIGRLYFAHGGVAWVAASQGGPKFSTLLRTRASLTKDSLRNVVDTSRASGRSFVELLVERQLVDHDTLRRTVLEHNARHFSAILERNDLEHVEFRPSRRAYSGDLTYTVDELVAERVRVDADPLEPGPVSALLPFIDGPDAPARNPNRVTNLRAALDTLMSLDGAIAAGVVDWESGVALGTRSRDAAFDVDVASSGHASMVKAKMAVVDELAVSGPIEDILITLGRQYHVIRPLTKTTSIFIFVAIDRAIGSLGLARHELKAVEAALTS